MDVCIWNKGQQSAWNVGHQRRRWVTEVTGLGGARGSVLQYSRNEVGRGGGIVPPMLQTSHCAPRPPTRSLPRLHSPLAPRNPLTRYIVSRTRYPVPKRNIWTLRHQLNRFLCDVDEFSIKGIWYSPRPRQISWDPLAYLAQIQFTIAG